MRGDRALALLFLPLAYKALAVPRPVCLAKQSWHQAQSVNSVGAIHAPRFFAKPRVAHARARPSVGCDACTSGNMARAATGNGAPRVPADALHKVAQAVGARARND